MTQMRLVADFLLEKKFRFLSRRNPSGTDIGRKIGGILFDEAIHMCAETELFLFCCPSAACTGGDCSRVRGGKIVLCDRFSDATYAYQGAGRGLSGEFIKIVNDWSSLRLKPDLTLLFDLPVEMGPQRAIKRNDSLADSSPPTDLRGKMSFFMHGFARDIFKYL